MALTVILFILIYVVAFVLVIVVPFILGVETDLIGGGEAKTGQDLLRIHNYLWIPLLVIVILLTIRIIQFGHRIAGPVFRMKQYLQTMKSGNFSRDFKLRQGDMLKDMEASINQFAEQMRSDFLRIKNTHSRCNKQLLALAESLKKEGKSEEAETLLTLTRDLELSLDKYKLTR